VYCVRLPSLRGATVRFHRSISSGATAKFCCSTPSGAQVAIPQQQRNSAAAAFPCSPGKQLGCDTMVLTLMLLCVLRTSSLRGSGRFWRLRELSGRHGIRRIAVILCLGRFGRKAGGPPSEWVVAINRNRWSRSAGVRTQPCRCADQQAAVTLLKRYSWRQLITPFLRVGRPHDRSRDLSGRSSMHRRPPTEHPHGKVNSGADN
jgi:hypothetical protein